MDRKGDVLLHICCGPCTLHPLRELRREGYRPDGYFFNPNIQPYRELQRRLEALHRLAADEELNLETEEEYPLEDFLRLALQAEERCPACYRLRLGQAADRAADLGYGAFTSTLLVSPYQRHEEIARIAAEEGRRRGLEFLYRDWRPGWPAAREEVRRRQLYLQPYCGCIFSERDRYCKR